jgi:hypothetical protein
MGLQTSAQGQFRQYGDQMYKMGQHFIRPNRTINELLPNFQQEVFDSYKTLFEAIAQ